MNSSEELINDHKPVPTQELFLSSWEIYRKMVDNDYLYHRDAYRCLRRVLSEEFDRPFTFIDVACGDANMTVGALEGTLVSHYTGLDISEQALVIAAQNLKSLDCEVSLHACDFSEALLNLEESADVVWIGLSLHHFLAPEKLKTMQRIRSIVGSSGRFLIYEDTSPDGESRDAWLARWDAQQTLWSAYSEQEWNYVTAHVHASDFPETDSTWRQLGHDAGFSRVEALYEAPSRLFRVYSFQA
jgi:ubiquinone/menaquinone biosynthesis C-methylase UbiE